MPRRDGRDARELQTVVKRLVFGLALEGNGQRALWREGAHELLEPLRIHLVID